MTIEEWDKIWAKFDPDHLPPWQREYLKSGSLTLYPSLPAADREGV